MKVNEQYQTLLSGGTEKRFDKDLCDESFEKTTYCWNQTTGAHQKRKEDNDGM